MVQRLIYITTDSHEEAVKIGTALVEERLAACANILHPMTSIYRWEGKVQTGDETVLILKTAKELVDAVTQRVLELHSYDCPCVVALPIGGGNPGFLAWIHEETVTIS